MWGGWPGRWFYRKEGCARGWCSAGWRAIGGQSAGDVPQLELSARPDGGYVMLHGTFIEACSPLTAECGQLAQLNRTRDDGNRFGHRGAAAPRRQIGSVRARLNDLIRRAIIRRLAAASHPTHIHVCRRLLNAMARRGCWQSAWISCRCYRLKLDESQPARPGGRLTDGGLDS